MIATLDLTQLSRFLAIVETGSFRAAAARLGISQATLSWSIQQLEKSLGAELITRGARGAVMTARGALLLPRAKLITSEVGRTVADFEEMSRQRNASITVGVAPMFMVTIFPAAAAATHAKFPDLTMRVVEGHSADLTAALQAGDIDMAFGGKPAADSAGVSFVPIHEQRYALVARAGHPVFAERRISDESALKHAWVMFDGVRFVSFEPEVFQAKGLPTPRIAARSASMPYIKALTLRSDHIGYLPVDYVREELATGAVREVPSSIMSYTATAGILTLQESAQTAAMKTLKAELRAACAGFQRALKSQPKRGRTL